MDFQLLILIVVPIFYIKLVYPNYTNIRKYLELIYLKQIIENILYKLLNTTTLIFF